MLNYRRDDLWDAATWADIDQAVLDEVQNVRVARKVFPTEDLGIATGGAPSWVSTAQVFRAAGLLLIPEGDARPFIELSVRFQVTPAQVEAEGTLHTARTLARMAAKSVAQAEDQIILPGPAFLRSALGTNTRGLSGLNQIRPAKPVRPRVPPGTPPEAFLDTVTDAITDLATAGWPDPYALILGGDLYTDAFSRLPTGETPERILASRLKHFVVSEALPADRGIVVSLAGESIRILAGHEAFTVFTGESFGHPRGALYNFRVFERFLFVVRDTSSVVILQR